MAETARKTGPTVIITGLMELICLFVFILYGLPFEPFFYAGLLLVLFLLVYVILTYGHEKREAENREQLMAAIPVDFHAMPPADSFSAADYQEMIKALGKRIEAAEGCFAEEKRNMTDYYTAWVHQIKTPISVMRMMLSGHDTEEYRALSAELFRIEQYVEMVLQYIRLDSAVNDLVIREMSLDELVRRSVRKYASRFVAKRLTLNFTESGQSIVTDGKWFSCIIDQILSNAIQYTSLGGHIDIFITDDGRLAIADNGIGIAKEDLPRIFERGFTGKNGRLNTHSSGLGLYLCQRAARKLSLSLSAESIQGKGSTFYINVC